MELNFGDFFPKLEDLKKRIEKAEKELANLATDLGMVTKIKSADVQMEKIADISTAVSDIYHDLGNRFHGLIDEFEKIVSQVQKVNVSSNEIVKALKKKQSDAIPFAIDAYKNMETANKYFQKASSPLNKLMNDFASVSGQVKGIMDVIKGLKKDNTEIELQFDTERYIW